MMVVVASWQFHKFSEKKWKVEIITGYLVIQHYSREAKSTSEQHAKGRFTLILVYELCSLSKTLQ
jgi:hypothetical protein